jgi:hypothetical protein
VMESTALVDTDRCELFLKHLEINEASTPSVTWISQSDRFYCRTH